MPNVVSALMCHAPIVVPSVVGVRGEACAASTRAMRACAARIMAHDPDLLVVISPHTPRAEEFAVLDGPRVIGDFASFGADHVVIDLPAAADLRASLVAAGTPALSPRLAFGQRGGLDHGALVPLAFLVEAGFRGRTLVVALPRDPTLASCRAFGAALRAAIGRQPGDPRVAVVASGDCSHRLIPGAPAGFHPQAHLFDEALHEVVAGARALDGFEADPALAALREIAAEDVVDAVAVAEAAAAGSTAGRAVLGYEGPYGVGYLVAVLHEEARAAADAVTNGAEGASADDSVLVDIARDALAAHLERRARTRFHTHGVDGLPVTGAFVTWRKGADLRGCVGRMHLDKPLSQAVAELAVSSASSDPRFEPVDGDEAKALSAEVTLLSPSLPVASKDELDPRVWGVEARHGIRHGVLLPDIEGVDTVDEQIQIVLRKAGIDPRAPYTLRKFRARKICGDRESALLQG